MPWRKRGGEKVVREVDVLVTVVEVVGESLRQMERK